jgi:hypothetical protein
MNTYSTGNNSAPGNTGSQAEFLIQLEKLLCFVTSNGIIDDMQAVPEVCTIVCRILLLMCGILTINHLCSSVLESGAYVTEHRRPPGI